jgi:Uncharacterized conserved protein
LETSLYLPVKRFLETLGFDVKGEICGCDLVALRGDSSPVVVVGELKLSFNLDLVLQGVDRTVASDEIWLAVRFSKRGRGREQDPRARRLCRLLGFGLLGVSASGHVEMYWSSRAPGARAAIPGGDRSLSRSTGAGKVIPPSAAAAGRPS